MRSFAAGLSLLLLCAAPALSDSTLPGFALSRAPNPTGTSVSCSLPGGDFVTFDGLTVARWNADGTHELNLAALPSFVFPSFVALTPAGDAVVIGDSGSGAALAGDLHLVQLDGSGLSFLGAVPYNFDGEFLPDGDLLVSAAQAGFGLGNDLVRVRLSPPSVVTIGHVDGPSGPLAVSRSGDVFYGTQPDPFNPPPPGSQQILRWSAGMLQSGVFLSTANASVYASGFDASAALEFEPGRERLHLAENDWAAGRYRVRRVRPGSLPSPTLATSDTWISSLRFRVLGGAATFDAYQPSDGVGIVYATTDFQSVDDLVTLAPARPLLALSGAGLGGLGPVELEISGGVPNGSALLTYCPQAAILPVESAYALPKFLHHSPFVLSATTRFTFLVPLDAAGAGGLSLWNPGDLQGQYGWQFMVGRANGTMIGSTNAVQF